MKQKLFILSLLFTLAAVGQMEAQNGQSIKIEVDDPYEHGGRSVLAVPSATLDSAVLNIYYPLAAESQVIIVDQSSQATVYSEHFTTTRSVVIDLAEEGIVGGTYTLRIYAFGKWWWGEFEIED